VGAPHARPVRRHHPRAQQLRFHTQTAGSTLTAQQPDNNIVRVALQALAAVLGGTQSLHCNGRDEALALPTEEARGIALRTQQIIAHESGVANTVDPWAAPGRVEAADRRDRGRRRASLLDRIDAAGGTLAAIEQGLIQREIQESAYARSRPSTRATQVVVGVNRFATDEPAGIDVLRIDPGTRGAAGRSSAAGRAAGARRRPRGAPARA
jgi:methylmalonyl-CoA mutase, N-terminal domain